MEEGCIETLEEVVSELDNIEVVKVSRKWLARVGLEILRILLFTK
jgi:hypothetical protein